MRWLMILILLIAGCGDVDVSETDIPFKGVAVPECDNLKSPVPGLKDSCFIGQAVNKSDPKICKRILTSKSTDTCYQALAVQLENRGFCEQIRDRMQKARCERMVTQ